MFLFNYLRERRIKKTLCVFMSIQYLMKTKLESLGDDDKKIELPGIYKDSKIIEEDLRDLVPKTNYNKKDVYAAFKEQERLSSNIEKTALELDINILKE